MPINTVRCPHCSARVNHIVKADGTLKGCKNDLMKCPRCKQDFSVTSADVSQRTREEVLELHDFEVLMSDLDDEFMKAVADDSGDTVEEALQKADDVFAEAKRALDEISLDATSEVIDADQLLDRYSIPEVNIALGKAKGAVMNRAESAARKAQDRFDLSDETVEGLTNIAEQAYDRTSDKVAAKVEEKADEPVISKLTGVLRRAKEMAEM